MTEILLDTNGIGGRAVEVVLNSAPRTSAVSTPDPLVEARCGESCSLSIDARERHLLSSSLAALTSRERDVVFAICEGGTNEAIADRMCIALPTLRTHLMRLNQKLGTTSKGDVVRHVMALLLEGYRRGDFAALPIAIHGSTALPRPVVTA